jgi:hypothetical protein
MMATEPCTEGEGNDATKERTEISHMVSIPYPGVSCHQCRITENKWV